MALYHVHAAVISKGQSHGGAKGFAQYIAREGQEHGTQALRYIQRDGSIKDDLVAKGSGALPSWAKDATHFFQLADRYERGGAKRPGTVARTYEIALPRELNPDQRLELAADIRRTFFEQFPHAWAIHNPRDANGGEHPHMHLMFSERGPQDGIARGAQQFFRQAARAGQDSATGGQRKDRSWIGPERLRDVRHGVATLTNAALERAGITAAVSHASLHARGQDREAVIYTRDQEKARIDAQRDALHRDIHPAENAANLKAWQAQKQRESLTDLSREAMVAHVKAGFWRERSTPVRARDATSAPPASPPQQTRQAATQRRTSRVTDLQQATQRVQARLRQRLNPARLLATLAQSKALIDAEQTGAALRVQLYQEQDKDRGMSW